MFFFLQIEKKNKGNKKRCISEQEGKWEKKRIFIKYPRNIEEMLVWITGDICDSYQLPNTKLLQGGNKIKWLWRHEYDETTGPLTFGFSILQRKRRYKKIIRLYTYESLHKHAMRHWKNRKLLLTHNEFRMQAESYKISMETMGP